MPQFIADCVKDFFDFDFSIGTQIGFEKKICLGTELTVLNEHTKQEIIKNKIKEYRINFKNVLFIANSEPYISPISKMIAKNNGRPIIFNIKQGHKFSDLLLEINNTKPTNNSRLIELSLNMRNNYLTPQDIFENLKNIRCSDQEYFIIFCLNNRGQQIKKKVISLGILEAVITHSREVFEPALTSGSLQIIISHTHSFGHPKPSKKDIKFTKSLITAGKTLKIKIIDHVIVSKYDFYSFKEHNLLF